MKSFTVVANTMQALVKYHGLKDWKLRIPYHDSISVNTTCLYSEVRVSGSGGEEGTLWVAGERNEDALRRIQTVSKRLAGKRFEELGLRLDSKNTAGVEGKGLGFSSSAGAAVTFALESRSESTEDKPDLRELSRVSRLFAASASRTMVGGFSRLHAGKGRRGHLLGEDSRTDATCPQDGHRPAPVDREDGDGPRGSRELPVLQGSNRVGGQAVRQGGEGDPGRAT